MSETDAADAREAAGRLTAVLDSWGTTVRHHDDLGSAHLVPAIVADYISQSMSAAKLERHRADLRAVLDGRLAARVTELEAESLAALTFLGHLVDHEDGPCRLDHHGCCQEHPGGGNTPCTTMAARQLLALARPAECECECVPGQPCPCPERDCYCRPCPVCDVPEAEHVDQDAEATT